MKSTFFAQILRVRLPVKLLLNKTNNSICVLFYKRPNFISWMPFNMFHHFMRSIKGHNCYVIKCNFECFLNSNRKKQTSKQP